MQKQPEFVRAYLSAAKALLKAKAVKEPVFSRSTYQVEVQDKKTKYFPFLQIKENGEVSDCFCSCERSESGNGCSHLAAAYLRIFNGFEEPLHVRFKKSLWNRLFQMAAKRHGYGPECLTKSKEGIYSCGSKTKKQLFSIEAATIVLKKRLAAIISEGSEQTEETSLKFSNWSADEIGALKAGKGSHALRYELSFWSDIAKWLMILAEQGVSYKISFAGQPIPHEIAIDFPNLKIWFYVAEVNWPWLIPGLSTVLSPLQVFDVQEEIIEHIAYDPVKKRLLIKRQGALPQAKAELGGYPVGDWLFVEGKGFYRRRSSPLFQKDEIPEGKITEILNQAYKDLQQFLPIYPDPIKAHYQLRFDPEENLHIECYLLEPGDLKSEQSACFIPWAYIDGKGFYRVEDWIFDGKEKIVPKQEVADFINRHRVWLHQFPGFQTHLGSLESHLIYQLSDEGELTFQAELNFPEGYEDARHFDEWVYLPGFGFYMKRESSGRLPLHPGLRIGKEEISNFIASHREELEQVQGFFSADAPIGKMGLSIRLNEEGCIVISPQREYAPGVDPKQIRLFGDYLFARGRGFSEIPPASRLPERFREQVVITASQETTFLAYELDPLRPYVVDIDPRLKKPSELNLKIRRIVKDRNKRSQEWLVDLFYQSELGSVEPCAIWDAYQEKRRHLFSSAGLLNLKDIRFNWIRQLPKRRIDRKRGMIRLNTLEWIRLSAFEQLEAPKGADPESEETRHLLEELQSLETDRILDISQLKATLRPYQEHGLSWLWFLYCHGLSGLLCDDMGLGKTHQAMALLAAVSYGNVSKNHKYLVVCPTSVIYHWQELLKRFLPHIRVCTYYGLQRTLEDFETSYDLVLTSYGILRTGNEDLRTYAFEVAIFDEIQIAKNQASQTHKALRSIHASMRLGLTGTPIENRVREIKSLFDVVLPSYMPTDAVFSELFVNPIEKLGDEEKKTLLGKLVKPFILRRKKSEVLTDLPEKIEEIAYCDLSPEQKELYSKVADQMRSTVYRELKDPNKPISYIHVFSALTALKQICDHPALVHEKVKTWQEHASGKWDLFVELLAEARDSGQKVVVFSQYLDMLAIIESYLRKKGIGFASIKGSTRDRSEQLRKFREDPECSVFVASLLAAGVGIDLTVASIVIHYDRWWNPAKENQATDRVHRIGQNRGVQVFKLVTKNTIEEHIHNLIEKKKGLLEEIVGVEDQLNFLNREELIQVFEQMFSN